MQVSAGLAHTALLLRDGTAVAFGNNSEGRCIPALQGLTYVENDADSVAIIVGVEVIFSVEADEFVAICRHLSGEQIARLLVTRDEHDVPVHRSICKVLQPGCRRLRVVLPDRRLVGPRLTWFMLAGMVCNPGRMLL